MCSLVHGNFIWITDLVATQDDKPIWISVVPNTPIPSGNIWRHVSALHNSFNNLLLYEGFVRCWKPVGAGANAKRTIPNGGKNVVCRLSRSTKPLYSYFASVAQILCSDCVVIVHLLCSYCASIVQLLCSYCVLLGNYCAHFVPVLFSNCAAIAHPLCIYCAAIVHLWSSYCGAIAQLFCG